MTGAATAGGCALPATGADTGTAGATGIGEGAGAPNNAITPGMAASMPVCEPGGVADRWRMLKMTTSASTGGDS